ncbi:hypothetical protein Pcinc_000802 [Petrolisthes cinctipes]|uniref:Ionotropic glutamate receptor L-glutamate and glycine-binding domain-containing protein n=1 Tax=Petrolisthes cinctipes TaxID=88211 RepID=A0AAE1GP07_PETCI|nr:hypothetical protein Pcinc_000802 [Petrolisthes cinctipes]
MVTELADGGGIKAEGPLSLLLDLLSKQLKFRYTLVPPIDGTWGMKTTDGNFTGMVGMLQRNVSKRLVIEHAKAVTDVHLVGFVQLQTTPNPIH